ncbi:MAG: hypothetical protein ACTSYA_10165 [Candidatus Kariarchaeaceae archaeon]
MVLTSDNLISDEVIEGYSCSQCGSLLHQKVYKDEKSSTEKTIIKCDFCNKIILER